MTSTAGILIEISANGVLGRLFDEIGGGKVGKALAQIDGVVLDRQGRIFSKDRRAKAAHPLRGLKGRLAWGR